MSKMRSFLIIAAVLLSACVSQPLPEGFKDKDDFDPIEAAKTRISLGLTYLQNGNYSQAKFNLDKALQFAPRLADAHYSMAYYYQQVGEFKLADASYQEAMDRAPKNPDIANSYGAFLCAQGQYEKAKSFFLKAVNAANYISTAETYENLALCSQSQGQIDDAVEYLQTALNHQPGRAKSLLLLAQLQMEQQNWQEAKSNLRRYEKMARVSPETLWLSIKIEKALSNVTLAKGYGDMLLRMYPNHPYALEYIRNRDHYTQLSVPMSAEKVQKQLKPSSDNLVADEPTVATDSQTDTLANTGQQSATPAKENRVSAPPVQEIEQAVENEQPEQTAMESAATEDEPAEPQQTEGEQPQEITQSESSAQTSPTENLQADDDAAPEAETPPEMVESVQTEEGYHVVQKGENLYRISLRYNVKMKSLIEWNELQDGSPLYVGKKLIVVDPNTVEQ